MNLKLWNSLLPKGEIVKRQRASKEVHTSVLGPDSLGNRDAQGSVGDRGLSWRDIETGALWQISCQMMPCGRSSEVWEISRDTHRKKRLQWKKAGVTERRNGRILYDILKGKSKSKLSIHYSKCLGQIMVQRGGFSDFGINVYVTNWASLRKKSEMKKDPKSETFWVPCQVEEFQIQEYFRFLG